MALMIARFGMDVTVILAAVPHDVVEDCGEWSAQRVEREFGARVAGIACELTEDKSRSWRERKEAGVENISRMSAEAAAMKAVDQRLDRALRSVLTRIAELARVGT
jgi:myo-inositol-1(or 4)-monophosphatase